MDLTSYRALGRSGLVVSPMGLGAMTFGTDRWGTPEAESRVILDAYVEAGGNFIDTAEAYSGGQSEEIVGRYVSERALRDKMVIATKFSWNRDPGNPNAGGNGAKNIFRAVDGSLRRLGTDYIDLYWLHFWDMVTPVEEVLHTFGDLVRSGKIRHFALSNVPVWYATKMAVLAQARGLPGPIALQMQYSLVERTVENEFVPLARDMGMGIIPWSPLGGGLLAGKYTRGQEKASATDRLSGGNPFGDTKFTNRNWDIVDVLKGVAAEAGCSPAQAALAWVAARPGVTSLLMGASRPEQLDQNIAGLDVALTPEQMETLDAGSAPAGNFFSPAIRRMIFGGTDVRGWHDV